MPLTPVTNRAMVENAIRYFLRDGIPNRGRLLPNGVPKRNLDRTLRYIERTGGTLPDERYIEAGIKDLGFKRTRARKTARKGTKKKASKKKTSKKTLKK